MATDARYRMKAYLDANINNANLTKDNGTTQVTFAVIYANPPYPLLKEFMAASSPVDLLFCIGEPNSTPILDFDQTPSRYEEHVPIMTRCIDKLGITGTKLKSKAEIELRRVCEANPTGSQIDIGPRQDDDEDTGSTVLYGTKFVPSYVRDTTT